MTNCVVHNGCRLSFSLDGGGPPVLFIQGVGLPGVGWRPQTDVLRASFACLCVDNRGTGGSDPKFDSLTVEQMAGDCRAVMDAVGWDSAHVVGHSLGGAIALQLALAERKRVRSLALLCTFADGRSAAPLTRRMVWLGMRSRVGTRRMRRRGFLGLIMSPEGLAAANADELAERFAPFFGHDLADQPPVVGKQLAAMRKFNCGDRLRELAGVPTLVLSAGHDPIAPPVLGRRLADRIAGAEFVEMSEASHGVPIEFASDVNELLTSHVAKAESRLTA